MIQVTKLQLSEMDFKITMINIFFKKLYYQMGKIIKELSIEKNQVEILNFKIQ